jgi:hypothetical protein
MWYESFLVFDGPYIPDKPAKTLSMLYIPEQLSLLPFKDPGNNVRTVLYGQSRHGFQLMSDFWPVRVCSECDKKGWATKTADDGHRVLKTPTHMTWAAYIVRGEQYRLAQVSGTDIAVV